MQRVGVSEVTLAVDSKLGAKLASTDRGQASEVIVGSCSFQLHQMARVKNVGGGPGDEDPRPPPRLPSEHKYPNADTARAAAVAATAERAEVGGARSGVVIADQLSPA